MQRVKECNVISVAMWMFIVLKGALYGNGKHVVLRQLFSSVITACCWCTGSCSGCTRNEMNGVFDHECGFHKKF